MPYGMCIPDIARRLRGTPAATRGTRAATRGTRAATREVGPGIAAVHKNPYIKSGVFLHG